MECGHAAHKPDEKRKKKLQKRITKVRGRLTLTSVTTYDGQFIVPRTERGGILK